jgi:hypothetical protein
MSAKTKIILGTVVGTTIAWVIVVGALIWFCNRDSDRPIPMESFYFYPPKKDPIAVMTWPHVTADPSAVGWEAEGGTFLVRLLSTNATGSTATVLYSHTSRPPEHVEFQTLLLEAHTNK